MYGFKRTIIKDWTESREMSHKEVFNNLSGVGGGLKSFFAVSLGLRSHCFVEFKDLIKVQGQGTGYLDCF